jgi:hypothetical protein
MGFGQQDYEPRDGGRELALTPRWGRVKIMGKVMAGMARRP